MTTTAYSYLRFSSKGQEAGDSLRRQTEGSRRYAAQHGWTLDESLRDLGVSAWKGKNKTGGALARFLKLVESGNIPKGSWLIVEAMDRLSREQVSDALTTFLQIVKAGVGIVTLQDQKQYTLASINANPFELMYSIGLMAGANEYSSKLSFRIREARERGLRNLAAGGRDPLHGKPPYWMKLNDGRYEVIPERVHIVKQMIQWSLEGAGCLGIARRLSKAGIKTKAGKSIWNDACVQHILRSRALMGEYTPNRIVNGKRVPVSEPVKGYYPAIVTEAEWLTLQAGLDTRKQTLRGRTGEMTNILGRVLKSGSDGSPMIVVAKDNGKGRKYVCLASADSVHGGQKMTTFNYLPVEEAFLHFIREVKLEKTHGEKSILPELLAKQQDQKKRLAKLQEALVGDDVGAIGAIAAAVRTVESKLSEIAKAIEVEKSKEFSDRPTTSDIASLADQLAQAEDKGEIRRQIKLAIAGVVKQATIHIMPKGIRRAAIVEVEFFGGAFRTFGVVTERSQPPILALDPTRTTSPSNDVSSRLEALLDRQYGLGNFQVTLHQTEAGEWKAMTSPYGEAVVALGKLKTP